MDWEKIVNKLNKTGANALDIDVLIYKKEHLECRLVIERVGDDEYKKRLKQAEQSAKSQGVGVSKQHKLKCRYNMFITNVNRTILPLDKIRKTYYLRWQIELVFKTWKSFFEINKLKKVKKERLECQLLAKLLWVLLNWGLFQRCNNYVHEKTPEIGVSQLKFFKRCFSFSTTLRSVILNRLNIKEWLKKIFLPLVENTACEAPIGKITHYQILHDLLS